MKFGQKWLILDQVRIDTTSTNGGNLTSGFDKDFTVPSVLNGITARIYIGVKVNGNTNNLHDFGIGGLQILDLTQSNVTTRSNGLWL